MKFQGVFILIMGLFSALYAQPTRTINPKDLNAGINQKLDPHFVYVPTTPNGKLMVFLAGSTAIPQNYQAFMEFAQSNGYHVIGLAYPNDVVANSICAADRDVDCFENFRTEVIEGKDLNPAISVDRVNSIEGRLSDLLQHLKTQFASENWAQFKPNTELEWLTNMAVAGHSQGAGHAMLIAVNHKIDRAISFSGTDWYGFEARPANWMQKAPKTDTCKLFGLIHELDEIVRAEWAYACWKALGIANSMSPIQVNTDAQMDFELNGAFTTTAIPENVPTQFHNSTAVSIYLPKSGGNIIFKPVWKYMLETESTCERSSTAIPEIQTVKTKRVYFPGERIPQHVKAYDLQGRLYRIPYDQIATQICVIVGE